MVHPMRFSPILFSVFSLLAAGVCFSPAPAQAGFQWVSPSDTSGATVIVPDAMPATRSSKAAPEMEIISPLVIEGTTPATSLPTNTLATNTLAAPAPVAPPPAPSAFSSEQPIDLMPAKPAEKAEKAEKIVTGFANKVPLAVALRQILPSTYGFSVDQDVKLTSLVSWQGGKPWRDVMQTMLQSAGLDMREQGEMVRIVRDAKAPKMEAEMTPPPAFSNLPKFEEPAPFEPKAQKSLGTPKSLAEPLPTKTVPANTLQLPSTYEMPVAEAVPLSSLGTPARIVDTWAANRGDMLRKVLETWAKKANVELNWLSEYDYPIQASITMTGNFEEAVRNLLAGFQEAQPQPIGRLHTNPVAGQTVLVVEARGNNFSE